MDGDTDPMFDDPHFRIIQQKIAEVGESSGVQVRKAEILQLEGLESCQNICLSLFLVWFQCLNILRPRTIRIFEGFGKVIGTHEEPGWYFQCLPGGITYTDVSTSIETVKVSDCNVPDGEGSPIVASAVFNYYIVDAIQATYGVDDLQEFLTNNAMEVVKTVCTLFPMRSKDAPSLLGSASMIGAAMRDLMQKRVE